ncbi:MAG: hypothetical protein ACK5ZV_11125 [bacterium]
MTETSALRARIYTAFRGQGHPLVVFHASNPPGRIIPGASIWTGARQWCAALRLLSLRPGDRLALALDPSPAWLMAFVAAAWEGLTIHILPAPASAEHCDELVTIADAALAVAPFGRWAVRPDHDGLPAAGATHAREDAAPPHALAQHPALLARQPRVVFPDGRTLTDDDLLAAADAAAHFSPASTLLNTHPWHHPEPFLTHFFPALLAGATILHHPLNLHADLLDPENRPLLELAEQWAVTHLSSPKADQLAATLHLNTPAAAVLRRSA